MDSTDSPFLTAVNICKFISRSIPIIFPNNNTGSSDKYSSFVICPLSILSTHNNNSVKSSKSTASCNKS